MWRAFLRLSSNCIQVLTFLSSCLHSISLQPSQPCLTCPHRGPPHLQILTPQKRSRRTDPSYQEILQPESRTLYPSPSAERVKFATGTIPKYKDTCRLTSDPYNKDFYMFSADDSEAPEAHFYRCDATNMKWTDLTVRPFIIYRRLCIF